MPLSQLSHLLEDQDQQKRAVDSCRDRVIVTKDTNASVSIPMLEQIHI